MSAVFFAKLLCRKIFRFSAHPKINTETRFGGFSRFWRLSMTIEERLKALEIKFSGSGWCIEGIAESENFSPSPMTLALKRIESLENQIKELKEQIDHLSESTTSSFCQIDNAISKNLEKY
jgi:uncharacterized coiled-coil protein SlyX